MTRMLLASALAALVAAPAVAAPPGHVQVVAREFSLSLSRAKLKPGTAIVQLVNFGQDAHDLRLRRVGGTRTYRIATVQPGGRADLRLKLLRGRYVLWCSIANHRALGMQATLLVKR
jgi:plastocyanin